MDRRLVRVFGWLVIAHGLSHAVLPLRGSAASTSLIGDWTPVVLYTISTLGFVTAGLGLLGLRPLDRAISPMLVLASGLSLVAIWRLGDSGLWVGGAFDAVLLLTGLWRAYGGWPVAGPEHGPFLHVLGLACGFTFLAYVALATVSWPWHRTWGSTTAEVAMALPGDSQFRDPAIEIQHALTINAPADRVWNAVTAVAGSRQIKILQERRAMLIEPRGAVVLMPTADGRTRLIIRSAACQPGIAAWRAALNFMTYQLPSFVRERRMMLTIKTLAEREERSIAAISRSE